MIRNGARTLLFPAGGLINQRPHLIDLSRWFLRRVHWRYSRRGGGETYFWKMPVDDNGFMLLRTEHNQIAFLHVSCTEWKNLFSLEIYGRNGKLDLNGLGGSYGIERITWYKMLPEMGPPETYSWEYPMADNSWNVEYLPRFLTPLGPAGQDYCGLEDAIAALRIVRKPFTRGQVMIIARSPLRITLGGGGTDLPSYYRDARRFPAFGCH